MPFTIKCLQKSHLQLLTQCDDGDVIALCKIAFDYLANGPKQQQEIYQAIAAKYENQFNSAELRLAVEALISVLIEGAKIKADENEVRTLLTLANFKENTVNILTQFVTSNRNFIEGSIKSANIRAYRLVNIEWRLETKLASRTVMKQSQVFVTMKLYLHTEPKNENRDFLEDAGHTTEQFHEDEKINRRDLLVQTDLNTLSHMIHSLEDALLESRSRRIRNIVEAIN